MAFSVFLSRAVLVPEDPITDEEWAASCKCRAADFFKNRKFDDEDDDMDGDF